jgi:hypothetical protein
MSTDTYSDDDIQKMDLMELSQLVARVRSYLDTTLSVASENDLFNTRMYLTGLRSKMMFKSEPMSKRAKIKNVFDTIKTITLEMPEDEMNRIRTEAKTKFEEAYPSTSGGRRMSYRSRKMKNHKKFKSYKKIRRGKRTKRRRY